MNITHQEENSPNESAELEESHAPSVEFNGKDTYRISGQKEALLMLGWKLYVALGGLELSPDACKTQLEQSHELRPRGGVFGIRFVQDDVLEIDNRNRRGDEEMNTILKEAVEKETQ